MIICGKCEAELVEDCPDAGRAPCHICKSKRRIFYEYPVEVLCASSHVSALTQREGDAVGYSESMRQGTASSGDLIGRHVVEHQLHGVSPQGEQDTMDTAARLVDWLNRDQFNWAEPSESSAANIDAIAIGVGENSGATLCIQVVRAIADHGVWHELAKEGHYSATLSLKECATMMVGAVRKKAGKINSKEREKIVLLLDANRCPGQALPAVVDEYRHRFLSETRSFEFAGVYVAGPWSDSISALDR